MTELYECFDASADIPEVAPHGMRACLGYLNSKEAADPWSLADWLRFGHLRQFPGWVAELYTAAPSARAQARQAAEQAAGLGWRPGRVIVADMEAWAPPTYWWADWCDEIRAAGYRVCWYGSEVYAAEYPCDLKWLALPDGIAKVPAGYQAKQYLWTVDVPGGVVDLSVMTKKLFDHGGQGPRHHPAAVATLRAALDYLTPHRTTTTQKGNTVSAVDKLHTFLEDHRGELETLLADVAPVAEAVLPAPIPEAVSEAVKLLTDFVAVKPADPTTPAAAGTSLTASMTAGATSRAGAETGPAPTVPDLPEIPGASA